MKVVKFKNGKYGVRKFSVDVCHIGYVFAINHTGNWGKKSSSRVQQFKTEDEAIRVMQGINDNEDGDRDMGVTL